MPRITLQGRSCFSHVCLVVISDARAALTALWSQRRNPSSNWEPELEPDWFFFFLPHYYYWFYFSVIYSSSTRLVYMCSVARARAPPAQYTEQRRERSGTQRRNKVEELGDGRKRGVIWSQCVHIVNTRPERRVCKVARGLYAFQRRQSPQRESASKQDRSLTKETGSTPRSWGM